MAEEILISTAEQFFSAAKIRIVRVYDSKVWDTDAEALGDSVAFADSLITLTQNSNSLAFPIEIPAGLPAGWYYAVIYSTATPTAETTPMKVWKFHSSAVIANP